MLMANCSADIIETEIFELSPELLNTLLVDRTMSTDTEQVNIFWATDNYAHLGAGYQYYDQIRLEAITGRNGNIIVPRAVKSRELQQQRSRRMAEVFTPSWVCNEQNNLVDGAWFGRDGVFNTGVVKPDGTHTWIVNPDPITFPEGKSWREYVDEVRMEITCGEAPYLASRYDTVTGEAIPLERRIGMLDRKLRVVGENTDTPDEWLEAAYGAFKGTYGFEWQGDNLVLAREALLYTFIDYYRAKFGSDPQLDSLLQIAYVISWNIWQMDGLKGVIPNSCSRNLQASIDIAPKQLDLFGAPANGKPAKAKQTACPGCKKKNIKKHIGTYCYIMDWEENKKITFVSLIKD